jgi:hypothetical protein
MRGQLEQIRDVGGMERLDQRTCRALVAILDRVEYGTDEFGLQPVVLVQLRLGCAIEFGVALHRRQIGLAHRLTSTRAPACP